MNWAEATVRAERLANRGDVQGLQRLIRMAESSKDISPALVPLLNTFFEKAVINLSKSTGSTTKTRDQ